MRPASALELVVTPQGLRFAGQRFPCVIGRGGISSNKREGDEATPAGTHRIVDMLYRPDRMPPPQDWAMPILPGDIWCDDPDHENYNHMARTPFAASHEALRRPDPLYDLILTTDWNWPIAEPDRGSAIFVHRWRRPGYPTAGCVGLRADHLRLIAARIVPGTRLVVQPQP
jgi:L,D-peptidoglycan transpeptidase YkuD (ErfK/YbiS/YcfS/YnhG family)